MPSLKMIRKRISSVKNTQKITKAMKMVSAAKLRRATEQAQSSRPYEKQLQDIVSSILRETDWSSPLTEAKEERKIGIVIVSTDRGLCGSLNSNLFKSVLQFAEQNSNREIEIIALGKKARDFFKKRNFKIYSTHLDMIKKADYELLENLAKDIQKLYLEEYFDRVVVFYNEFHSALLQKPMQLDLLPLIPEEPKSEGETNTNFILEPSGATLLEKFVPMLVHFKFYRVVIESFASEHAARMTAMDSATKNARDMIDRLTLQRNRARQAAITKELMEIIGGAEAISV